MPISDNNKTINKDKVYTKEKKKKIVDSDSDDINSESENEEEFDVQEYRKILCKIFPSKYLKSKVKDGHKLKKIVSKIKNISLDDDESEPEVSKSSKKNKSISQPKSVPKPSPKKSSNKNSPTKHKIVKKKIILDEEKDDEEIWETEDDDDEEEEDTDYSEDSEEEDSDEEDVIELSNKSNKVNIIFTIGGGEDEMYDEYDDYETEDEEDEDYETEDEDESVSSQSSVEEKKVSKKKKSKELVEDNNLIEDCNNEQLKRLKELYNKSKNDKDNLKLKKCIELYQDELKKEKKNLSKKIKKQKDKNSRIFRKITRDKNTMNDASFFAKLNVDEQKKIIKEVREINTITRIERPYRITLLESEIPPIFKAAAMKKINSLRYMEPGSGEFYKIKNWVDTFMKIPFNKYNELPINIDNGLDECHNFIEKAQKTLDEAVFGLNDAKMQIMQMLGQLLTNPKSIGTAIAIHGPPGTGKTSLVKEGISKILDRPFAFIALGGATDSSFLEGHSYTYEGSIWGKIVQILIDSKCMNPVIYFDELDKISDTPRGEEIAGILTHLTDTSQNNQFHDKYFAEINFDLSKCLFIFSYNDESKVNAILKDRMYRIETKGYNLKQKTSIGNNYLLPKIREQIKFSPEDIIIPDESLHHIIDNHCNKEHGVRNLKRCLEIIYTKLNLYRLMKPNKNLFEEELSLKVEFPFTVTKDLIDKLIKKDTENISAMYSMYL